MMHYIPGKAHAYGSSQFLRRPRPQCAERLKPGLQMLLDAIDYAADTAVPADEFAVDIPSLYHSGFLAIDFRWLTQKGFLRSGASLSNGLIESVCLTPMGILAVRELLGEGAPHEASASGETVPLWDASRRELRWIQQLVKRFRVPAPNQELILSTFQEDGWPPHIDDPLPQVPSLEPKRRLHDTIIALNRHRVQPAVRFLGDGTGQGVRWESERS